MNKSEYSRNYKRTYAGKFMLVDGDKIAEKISGADFCATKKIDGIMAVLFLTEGKVEMYNSSGKEIGKELPCLEEFARTAADNGIKNAIFGAELYATISKDGRERVCDVAQALSDASLHSQLRLAMFDVMELEGVATEYGHYKEKHACLRNLFGRGNLVSVVAGKVLDSKHGVAALFENVVTQRGAEGLVVHNENGIVYKIKPRHTVDAVVIGYTLGEDTRSDMARDLLVAVMEPDGAFREIASVGVGLSDAMRAQFYSRLKDMHVDSDFIKTDSRNIAFQMVRPEIVVEISAVDYVTENSAGEPKPNALLDYDSAGCYRCLHQAPGVSLHSPVFLRERPDKTAVAADVPVKQLTDIVEFSGNVRMTNAPLGKSEIIERRVFMKEIGPKRLVQKYVIWKTNKESDSRFPAYVLHLTDYNYHRIDALKRDIRVSNSREQIFQLLDKMLAENIKKGWHELVARLINNVN